MGFRDAESQGASQADLLHWSHAKSIQHLEEQAIEEESKSQLDFLSSCQAALWASPVKLHSMLVASYHILVGQTLMPYPFNLSQGASSSEQVSAMWLLPLLCLGVQLDPGSSILSRPGECLASQWDHIQSNPRRAPNSKQWEIMPLHKVLTQSCLEAFSQDSSLVREEYFTRHCPNFNTENIHDLSDIFQCMAGTAELLGSAIYEMKKVWTG